MSSYAYNMTPLDRWGRTQRVVRWGLVFGYVAIIFCLSSLPGQSVPSLKLSDKVLHAVEFGGLAWLTCRALRAQAPGSSLRFVAVVSVLGTVGYGLTDELHQLFVPGRSAEFTDVAADGLGALLAAWAWVQGGTRWQRLQ